MESRRLKNRDLMVGTGATPFVSKDVVERQKELAENKNEFLKEKGQERKTMQGMLQSLKTRTN